MGKGNEEEEKQGGGERKAKVVWRKEYKKD